MTAATLEQRASETALNVFSGEDMAFLNSVVKGLDSEPGGYDTPRVIAELFIKGEEGNYGRMYTTDYAESNPDSIKPGVGAVVIENMSLQDILNAYLDFTGMRGSVAIEPGEVLPTTEIVTIQYPLTRDLSRRIEDFKREYNAEPLEQAA